MTNTKKKELKENEENQQNITKKSYYEQVVCFFGIKSSRPSEKKIET